MEEDNDMGDFTMSFDNEEYFVNNIRDLRKYVKRSKNPNTTRKTESTVKKFSEFLEKEGFKEAKITEFGTTQLDALIGKWLLDAKKEDGTNYEPDTLTSMHRGLDRYLVENNYEHNILTSPLFDTSRKVLAAKRGTLKGFGLGNKKNRADSLTVDDENSMWRTGALGERDAETLQNTVWFVLAKNLGFRGCQESRQLSVGDLEEKKDSKGNIYIEWTEKISKIRQGNSGVRPFNPKLFQHKDDPTRCPVRLVKLFNSKKPEEMKQEESPFFLQINRSKTPKDKIWYKSQPLGVNSLSNFMKKIVKSANLDSGRKLTNHSIRKTCCSRLLDAGVPGRAVAQLSGHKRVESLNNYSVLNIRQQEAMSHILGSDKEETNYSLPGARPLCIENNTENLPVCTVSKPTEKMAEIDESQIKPVVFHVNNTGPGTIQIVYGNQPQVSRIARNEHESIENTQIINPNLQKRKRILPLNYSDSDSD